MIACVATRSCPANENAGSFVLKKLAPRERGVGYVSSIKVVVLEYDPHETSCIGQPGKEQMLAKPVFE